MTEALKKTIEEEVAGLPEEMRDAVRSFDWVKTAEAIGTEHEWGEEEISDFQLETLLVLIGAVDAGFYAVNIENHVLKTKEESEKAAGEAFTRIFAPINEKAMENLKKTAKEKNADFATNLDFILSGGDYTVFLKE